MDQETVEGSWLINRSSRPPEAAAERGALGLRSKPFYPR